MSAHVGAIAGSAALTFAPRPRHVEAGVHSPLNHHRVDVRRSPNADPDASVPGRLPFSAFLLRQNLIHRAAVPDRVIFEKTPPGPQTRGNTSDPAHTRSRPEEGERTRRPGPEPLVGVDRPACPCQKAIAESDAPSDAGAGRLRRTYISVLPRPGMLIDVVI